MLPSLIVMGISFVEKAAAAHFAKHGVKVPSATKQSMASAVIGDAVNLLPKVEGPAVPALAVPANITELIDIGVAVMKEFETA